MAPYERQNKQELNPNRELERHLLGLRSTQEAIKDFRMRSRLGHASMPENGGLSMHANDHSRHQFASMARNFSEKIDGHRDPDTKMYADILSIVPNTVDSLHILQGEYEDRPKDYNATMHMINFNDTLGKVIDTHPAIQPRVITGLLRSAALRYGYGADVANEMVDQTRSSLQGIKHERAFEAALYYLPDGYEIYDATAEEDKHGADVIVRCPNGVTVSIDVKSSPEAADRAAERQRKYEARGGKVNRHEIILYSGFGDEDFSPQNPWQPKPEAIDRVLPHIEAILRHTAGMHDTRVPEKVG